MDPVGDVCWPDNDEMKSFWQNVMSFGAAASYDSNGDSNVMSNDCNILFPVNPDSPKVI